MQSMNLLITGAEGFVGRNLAEGMSAGKYTLLCPTRAELDLADELAVERFLDKNEVNAIVHAATTLRQGTSYPSDTCENNLRMFFNLQKFKSSEAKLINLGSGSEYSRKHWHGKMNEGFFDKNIPQDSHSYAKYLISKYVQERADETLISLRLFGIYGRYEDYRFKFISNAIVKNILKLPIVINQNVVYDYLCVADLSRILPHFLDHPASYRTYNVTPTRSIDLITIAEFINEVSDFRSEVVVLHSGIGVEYSGDNERLMTELGDFEFEDQKLSIMKLWNYYAGIKESLNVRAIMDDDYLNYAKDLRENYFESKNDKQNR